MSWSRWPGPPVHDRLLEWLRTPGPSGEYADWTVAELARAAGCAATSADVALQRVLLPRGDVIRSRVTRPALWRAA